MEYYALIFIFLILSLLGGLYLMRYYTDLSEEKNQTRASGLVTSINKGIGIAD